MTEQRKVMTPTAWDLSELKDYSQSDVAWTVGTHPIIIRRVTYIDEYAGDDKSADTYNVNIECVEGECEGATATIRYFLKTKSGEDNRYSIGTLNSLWKAIYGPTESVGVPAPGDVEGCVVMADVTFRDIYVQVYHYHAPTMDYAMYSDKAEEQYFLDL